MLKYKKLAEHTPSKKALKEYFKEIDYISPYLPKYKAACEKMIDLISEVLYSDPEYATTSSHYRGVRDSAVCFFR